ncbi:MAG: sulfatase [Nitrospirae bacterium]|nr:sulfatase [Nitrospirota bacterium]
MNICILLLDCLRADHLSCYGYPKPTSPNIDAVAREGLLFEDAVSQSNWTYPSVYSMMTGRYPSSLAVSWWDQRVNENVPLLPEILSANGYRTGLITSFKGLLNPRCFCSHFQENEQLKIKDDLPGAVRKWTRKHDNSFLFLHIGEFVHEPFFAERKYIEMFLENGVNAEKASASKAVDALTSRTIASKDMRKVMSRINMKMTRLSGPEIAYLKAAYDAGIYCADRIVNEIYSVIRGSNKEYCFILLADHGQALMEHGVFGHGLTLYEELIHVPLIMDLSGRLKGKVSTPVQLMDLFPTILELLGIEHDNIIDGHSLMPLIHDRPFPERGTVAEGYPYLCVRKGGHKLITKYSRLKNYTEIYNPVAKSWKRKLLTRALHYLPDKVFSLGNDREERKNLAMREGALYRSLLDEINEIAKRFTLQCRPAHEVGIDEEILRQLKDLGYI